VKSFRLGLAAVALATLAAPLASAHAYTCVPHFHVEYVDVAGRQVPTVVYDGMIC
jgi:hypothetical protein